MEMKNKVGKGGRRERSWEEKSNYKLTNARAPEMVRNARFEKQARMTCLDGLQHFDFMTH